MSLKLFIIPLLISVIIQCFFSETFAAIVNSDNYGSDNDDFDKKHPVPDATQKTPLDNRLGTKMAQKLRGGEWVIAPVPNYDPSQGWGLVLLAQRIFAHEENVKPSIAVGAVFVTEKKSYGGVAGYVGRLNEDRLRLNLFGGYAKVNSDFYGIGKDESQKDMSVLLEQNITFLMTELVPRIGDGFYLGPTLSFMDFKNSFNVSNVPPTVDPSSKLDSQAWVPGVKVQYDKRNNTFYPTEGIYTNFQMQFYDERFGGGHTFQHYKANYNQYFQILDDQVLAARAALQVNVGDVPFYHMAMFGQGPDLRGFKSGKYRDKMLWATQAEYRQRFNDHWGMVLFAGVGDVAEKASDLSLTDLLWSGGTGVRYRLGKENPVDFRVDVAHGDDWVWYFSVNQAF
ncbi:BamA/TamA family outer membrane protein [Bdellovibrio sp. HCB185ZH]|uniref:BamA/TamA family outer membrane protein n=1 Tax=Bdellovibrio sp. HCB185ZH TaxID=3394235 RepID=UPI0039A68DC6